MAMTFRPKVWIGLTATLATSVSLLAAQSAYAGPDAHGHGAPAAHGGEGGEAGGEHGQAADPLDQAKPDEALEVRLILMKGHLDVGHELYRAGIVKDATPHISHPSTELYGHVEGELKAQNVPGFHDKLEDLRLAFEAKAKGRAFEQPYTKAVGSIDRALAVLNHKDETPPSPARLASLILNVAADEYGEAFAKGDAEHISAATEYQDALGFYRQARALIDANAASMRRHDAKAFAKVKAHLGALKRAWRSAAVPRDGVAMLSAERFQSEVDALTDLLKHFS